MKRGRGVKGGMDGRVWWVGRNERDGGVMLDVSGSIADGRRA